ncbi:hypothetical protein M4I32_12450 [Microbacterium sp. LRZ72]|uniref:hypothetical protein n=1 Tax=Microbacterium sp. LRZ72 TaxID=2942481 RepID=UPI0029ACFFD7|nr:hypothetical protein [Microbacterium sp. LRZ72]MDX2377611.1 hypothetical protein [Microbacterium sp. LRZ72]
MSAEDEDEVLDAMLAAELADWDVNNRGGASVPLGAVAIDWKDLADDRASEVWRALRDWVEWFTARYDVPVSSIPNCWWQHPALVEELSALHTAHRASFDASDSGFGPIGWHERLAMARPRWRQAYAGSCTDGHQPEKPRSWSGTTDEREWEAWTRQSQAP